MISIDVDEGAEIEIYPSQVEIGRDVESNKIGKRSAQIQKTDGRGL
jgi:hypothetical protein